MSGRDYSAVPNPGFPHEASAMDIGDRQSMMTSHSGGSFTPEMRDSAYLGPSGPGMAPSIAGSRDSTYSNLAAPSVDGRSSWGSSKALAAAGGLGAGAATADNRPRVHSALAQGYTSPFPDDDEAVGHHAPTAAVPHSDEKVPAWAAKTPQRKGGKKGWLVWGLLLLAALIALAVGLGVGLGVGLKNKENSKADSNKDGDKDGDHKTDSGASADSPTATASGAVPEETTAVPTTGGDGSIVLLDDGTNMTYTNRFGGFWVWDEADPFNNNAQPNSWTPPLNQSWKWGVDRIYGVNLGGWLNTEPFISPDLYEDYLNVDGQTAIDEYTLSQNMGADLEKAMTQHYETFITERDFAEIAAAGLNWIRLPIAHWAISKLPEEPYLERVSWTYVLKAIKWARKYGLRINLDLHTAPGSQNGWNHSGKIGTANFMHTAMGLANAQRTLDYIRTLAQFISQPQYLPVIQMFGFLNEPNGGTLGKTQVGSFYYEAYRTVRAVTGTGEGNGPMLSMHDAFLGIDSWYDFGRGMDRMSLDQHPYLVFQDQMTGELSSFMNRPCTAWATGTNTTSAQFGPNNAGEWSAAINDCGQWLNGVNLGQRYDGSYDGYSGKAVGSCAYWNDSTQWDQTTKDNLKIYVMSAMDALQNFFFWTWKIGNSTQTPVAQPNPMWHYRLGLQNGWIPTDPRESIGQCGGGSPWDGQFTAGWMTGTSPPTADSDSAYPWPPPQFADVANIAQVAQFTATADPVTMPGPTFTAPDSTSTIDAGNGWHNPSDSPRKAFAPISDGTCTYPPEYTGGTAVGGLCGAGLTQPSRRDVQKRAYPIPTRRT